MDFPELKTASIQRLEGYIEKLWGRLILVPINDTVNTKTNITNVTIKQKWEEKQLYLRFKRFISNTSHERTWMWLRKGNHKNTLRNNRIKARTEETQQHSKLTLFSDRNKTTNPIISERSKLAQKGYKTRHDWEGKMIYWERCKKFKVDHMNKWYMHNTTSVLENNKHKLHWDFDIQTDHLL